MFGRPSRRGRITSTVVLTCLVTASLIGPSTAGAASDVKVTITADLDGKPIDLILVGKYHCQDFDYPRIHCYSDANLLAGAVTSILALTGVDYVLVFDQSWYAGASMYISQNYTALATLGWNDRISSMKARNSESGIFWTDWFYGGSSYGFCCNLNYPGLGAYDNTFSSVYRT